MKTNMNRTQEAAKNSNDAAQGVKQETFIEVLIRLGYLKSDSQSATQVQILVAILIRIQRMYVRDQYVLMTEHWDWIVVLQCMQAHNLFKSNPKRPPFAAFDAWLKKHDVPQLLAHCSVRNLTYVNQKINGKHYPWTDVQWESAVLRRWRKLYETLDKMFNELQTTDIQDTD